MEENETPCPAGIVYETERATDKFHTSLTMPWEDVWGAEQAPVNESRFATIFRLRPGLHDYWLSHQDFKTGRNTIAGFKDAIPGVVAIDIDRDDKSKPFEANVGDALTDLRQILHRLKEEGVAPSAYVPFFSGSKGFHVQFMPEAFGSALMEIPAKGKLPAHERAVRLALKAVAGTVLIDNGLNQTIRLFRVPNSRHDKRDMFKIVLTEDEVFTLSAGEIIRLASSPRTGISQIPSRQEDASLIRLLKLAVEKDDAIAVPTMTTTARQKPAQPIAEGVLPSDETVGAIRKRIGALLGSCKYLRDAWNSVPIRGRNNSSSEFDWRLAVELFLLGWTWQDTHDAILIRPNSNARSQPSAYLQRTLTHALESAETKKAKGVLGHQASVLATSPAESIAKTGSTLTSWLGMSRIWDQRMMGRATSQVFSALVRFAIDEHVWVAKEGEWSPVIQIPRSAIIGHEAAFSRSESRICSESTYRRALVLLRVMGMVKRIKAGGIDIAPKFSVRIPTQNEIPQMMWAIPEAIKMLRKKSGRLTEKEPALRRARTRVREVIYGHGNMPPEEEEENVICVKPSVTELRNDNVMVEPEVIKPLDQDIVKVRINPVPVKAENSLGLEGF